jgi:Sperm-tail PG-rich repeat
MGFKTFSTQGASLDKGQRAELQTKHQLGVPGPGKYAAIDATSRNDKPKYGFGTSTRPDIDGS